MASPLLFSSQFDLLQLKLDSMVPISPDEKRRMEELIKTRLEATVAHDATNDTAVALLWYCCGTANNSLLLICRVLHQAF